MLRDKLGEYSLQEFESVEDYNRKARASAEDLNNNKGAEHMIKKHIRVVTTPMGLWKRLV